MIILIDMDDVLADFDGEFYRRWNKVYPNKHITPPNERKCFYLTDESPKEYTELIKGIYTVSGFVKSLPEIPGSIEAVNEISSMGYTIFICTTPLNAYKNCVIEKYEWIEEHLGYEWTKKLILTKDKTVVRGDILIDDKPEITGAVKPVWEHIVFDKPYNKHTNHTKRMTWKNWKSVLLNE
jgi:5'-nucleotidase